MGTEEREVEEKMSSAVVDTSEQEMQSEEIKCQDKDCAVQPDQSDVALDAKPIEAPKKEKKKKKQKQDKFARTLEIIRDEIRTRVPVIFKELMEKEMERKEGRVQKEVVAHPNIICDGCGAKPILGVRYKCTVR